MAAFSYGGINFREAANYRSPEGAWGTDHSRVTTEYLVAWTDRDNARLALLGGVSVQVGSQANNPAQIFTYLSRKLPHQYLTGDPLYATAVTRMVPEGTPSGKDNVGIASYTDCRMTVTYEYLEWDVLSDDQIRLNGVPDESQLTRYVVRTAQDAEKQLTYRSGSLQWTGTTGGAGGGPLAVQGPVGIPIPVTEISYLWVQVPESVAPRSVLQAAVGSVNSVAFDNCQPYTLLVRAPRYERVRLPDNTRALNIDVRMTHNPRRWDFFPDPRRSNRFCQVQNSDGSCIYPLVDPATLFRPVQGG